MTSETRERLPGREAIVTVTAIQTRAVAGDKRIQAVGLGRYVPLVRNFHQRIYGPVFESRST